MGILRLKQREEGLQKAFTLIELSLSMGILVVALCGLLLLFNVCYSLSVQARNSSIAAAEARSSIEQMHAHNYSTIVADYNGVVFPLTALNGNKTVTAAYVAGAGTGLLQADVTVTWQVRGGGLQNLTLSALIAER